MMVYWKYLKYVFKHKWYVFLECCKYGIIWRGVVHDLSKLLPSEFFSYARWFYDRPDEKLDQDKFKAAKRAYEFSWLWHLKRNKHHWQWFILGFRDGKLDVFEIPMKYRREMLADWRGVSRALNKGYDNTRRWYEENKDKMRFGEDTKKWIEKELGVLKKRKF